MAEETHIPERKERRKAQRLSLTAAAEVIDVKSNARVTGRCADLALGGCYIDTISPFEVGTTVRVRLERELREFEAVATVSYALVSMGMGLSFTQVKPEHHVVLKDWINEIRGGKTQDSNSAVGAEEGIMAAIMTNREVLDELINLMVRKKLISDNEAAGLLRLLSR